MPDASGFVNAIVGGWRFSPVVAWNSGNLLPFGGMLWDGTDPKISSPTPQQWFNTAPFERLPDYTPRTNPWDFSGLRGPQFFNMDGSLVKQVNITESMAVKLEVAAFNLLNYLNWDDPSTSVDDSNFGVITEKRYLTYGRRLQLGVRFEF